MESLFTPSTIDKIRADPKLAPYMNQPDFVVKLNEIIANPKANMEKHINDQRIMQVSKKFPIYE